MLSELAAKAHATLARLESSIELPEATVDERIRWAAARLDGGDRDGAADELVNIVKSADWLPPLFAVEAPRIVESARVRDLLTAAIEHGHVYRDARTNDGSHDPYVARALAHLVVGDTQSEDTLLRAVLVVREYEGHSRSEPAEKRASRIRTVLATFAAAHPDEPTRLDRWADMLGESDRHRLAAAAPLLAPMGLAETVRCGRIDDDDVPPLSRALLDVGRFDEALTLTERCGDPWHRQQALVGLASTGLSAAQAKSLVAMYRKCPKSSRARDSQMVYKHRFARLFLALNRVDEALEILRSMRDCRIYSYGPAYLARDILQWHEQHRDQIDAQRIRLVLDVLATENVLRQDLTRVAPDIVCLAYTMADEPLRAELIDVHLPRLRNKLRWFDHHRLLDAGLGMALSQAGQFDAALVTFQRAAAAAGKKSNGTFGILYVEAADRAGLPEREPATFADLVADALTAHYTPDSFSTIASTARLTSRLGPHGRAAVPGVLNAVPARWVTRLTDALAAALVDGDELDTLAVLMDTVSEGPSAITVCRYAAMALARHGNATEAAVLARNCGLTH